MKTYFNPSRADWQRLCQRPVKDDGELEAVVASIFSDVLRSGDRALSDYTERFDGVSLDSPLAGPEQIRVWAGRTPKGLRQAIDTAYANIKAFHEAQAARLRPVAVETMPGVRCWREPRPIEKVGLYIPGGSAPLFSTVLMLGIPARLAGCKDIVLCSPPQADGTLSPAICYAARLCGVTKIILAGGAQAVAALALGTGTVAKVDKIFGPGNQYVTAAKLYAGRFGIAIDMPAGPSEVMVVADDTARPEFIAADLLSQAEHGPDSQAILVCTDKAVATTVGAELKKQLRVLPRREVAGKALKNSFCAVLGTVKEALEFADVYAPEHLILNVARPRRAARTVTNAGSVFLGSNTPESAGDYASGTNHTLPTNGWTRSYGGLSVESFCKYVTFQSLTKSGVRALAPAVMAMAEAEGLEAHRRAMEIRL